MLNLPLEDVRSLAVLISGLCVHRKMEKRDKSEQTRMGLLAVSRSVLIANSINGVVQLMNMEILAGERLARRCAGSLSCGRRICSRIISVCLLAASEYGITIFLLV